MSRWSVAKIVEGKLQVAFNYLFYRYNNGYRVWNYQWNLLFFIRICGFVSVVINMHLNCCVNCLLFDTICLVSKISLNQSEIWKHFRFRGHNENIKHWNFQNLSFKFLELLTAVIPGGPPCIVLQEESTAFHI